MNTTQQMTNKTRSLLVRSEAAIRPFLRQGARAGLAASEAALELAFAEPEADVSPEQQQYLSRNVELDHLKSEAHLQSRLNSISRIYPGKPQHLKRFSHFVKAERPACAIRLASRFQLTKKQLSDARHSHAHPKPSREDYVSDYMRKAIKEVELTRLSPSVVLGVVETALKGMRSARMFDTLLEVDSEALAGVEVEPGM
ncbi:hypothetical protein JCM3770_006193 [Rhodotorula araucariae]